MNPVLELIEAIDRSWGPSTVPKITLPVLGSTALFLQTDYIRGTKDGDVLETNAIDERIRSRLLAIAGRGTLLHQRHKLYLDVVSLNVPMLPCEPRWHRYPIELVHFDLDVLDPHDVVVSKLKRWNAGDRDDVRAMAEGAYLDRDRLVSRFEDVVRRYTFDARADLLPKMAGRFNQVERDWFALGPTAFDLPDECFR